MNGECLLFPPRQSAWEQQPWHQVHWDTNGRLANAGKHESGVQRLKVAQIFTTRSALVQLRFLSMGRGLTLPNDPPACSPTREHPCLICLSGSSTQQFVLDYTVEQ